MTNHDDLNWLAFRYVAGELTDEEHRAFESQLVDDQSAREAVAGAYELTRCARLAAVEHYVAPARLEPATANSWAHFSAAVAGVVGLAACLLLLLAVNRLPRPEDGAQSVIAPVAEPVLNERLALVWSETRQPLDDPFWPTDNGYDDNDETPVALVGILSGDESTGWIQAAVLGLAGE